MDDARGMFTYETIYDDTNADQIATVADTQLHRDVDLVIESADKAGKFLPDTLVSHYVCI